MLLMTDDVDCHRSVLIADDHFISHALTKVAWWACYGGGQLSPHLYLSNGSIRIDDGRQVPKCGERG
jgi:hypothetical protein